MPHGSVALRLRLPRRQQGHGSERRGHTTVVSAPDQPTGSASVVNAQMGASTAPPTMALPPWSDMPTIYADTPSGRRAETARQTRRSERFAQYWQVVALHE